MIKRIEWIDIAKAIGVFLVILGHTDMTPFLKDSFYEYHLPLFFFLSGLTFKKASLSDFPSFFKKKVRTLVVPYIGFSVILFAFWFFVRRNYGLSGVETLSVQGALWQIFMGQTSAAYAAPTWFLTCLFCTEIVFFFMLQIKNKGILTASIICSGILGSTSLYLVNELDWSKLFWNIESVWFYLVFVALGYAFTQYNVASKFNNRPKVILATIPFIIAFTVLYTFQVKLASPYFEAIINIPLAILGLFMVVGISILIKRNRVLSFFGKSTLIIFTLHMIMLSLIKGILVIVFHMDEVIFEGTLIPNLLLGIATLISIIPLIFFINRFMPWLIGKKRPV